MFIPVFALNKGSSFYQEADFETHFSGTSLDRPLYKEPPWASVLPYEQTCVIIQTKIMKEQTSFIIGQKVSAIALLWLVPFNPWMKQFVYRSIVRRVKVGRVPPPTTTNAENKDQIGKKRKKSDKKGGNQKKEKNQAGKNLKSSFTLPPPQAPVLYCVTVWCRKTCVFIPTTYNLVAYQLACFTTTNYFRLRSCEEIY